MSIIARSGLSGSKGLRWLCTSLVSFFPLQHGNLLAYRTQVESTREWSFDSSSLLRFGLYLLIPVASMVGGALLERVVNMVLD